MLLYKKHGTVLGTLPFLFAPTIPRGKLNPAQRNLQCQIVCREPRESAAEVKQIIFIDTDLFRDSG